MENDQPHWASTILYSLAWLICSLLVIVDVLAVREASLDVLTAMQSRRIQSSAAGERANTQIQTGFSMDAIDRGIMFFGGIVAVSAAIGIEYYFRLGQRIGRLWQRIAGVLGILVAIFIVCVLIQTFV